jgi:3-deoxy-manno-octulosonate cytidylyltransferase (CMP-KDO synthetase)
MLLAETGKPLVLHTWEAATQSRLAQRVIIATDSPEIESIARHAGAEVVMTSPAIRCGTDRVAQAVEILAETGWKPEIVVNLQGDEPEIDPAALDELIETLDENNRYAMATLAAPLREKTLLFDPACVKVVFDSQQRAIYFSRSPIPYPRSWDDALLQQNPPIYWQHIGVYAFRLPALMDFTSSPPVPLEAVESLEQLRALWHGVPIAVVTVAEHFGGIDTPADYARFVQRVCAGRQSKNPVGANLAAADPGFAVPCENSSR